MSNESIAYKTRLELEAIRDEIQAVEADIASGTIGPPPGVDRDEVKEFGRSIDLEYDGAGADPETVSLIVTILTSGPIYDLWHALVLPRIRRRFGEDSMVERKDDDQ